jgi:phytanoyl-CoA hydroxylase
VIEDFVPPEDCDALRQSAGQLVDDFDPSEVATVFSTHSHEHAASEYFVKSGDKVRFFFEENVLDDGGLLVRPKAMSINKMGHAMHDLVPAFQAFSYHPRVVALAEFLGLDDALVIQSMLIFKQPGIGGEVTWHQDGTYLLTEPQSVTGFWFALEDADLSNGCLWVLPGEHRKDLRQRFRRVGGKLQLEELGVAEPFDLSRKMPLEVQQGTLVVLHGRLPHYSEVNRSGRSRHAYTLHTISASATYLPDNWLQRGTDMPLRYLSSGESV